MKSDVLYERTIFLNPIPKKNNGRIVGRGKRSFLLPSKRYVDYEKACIEFLSSKKPKQPISELVNVQCIFYRATRHRVDISNLFNAIDDILVAYGILEDDNMKIVGGHDGSRVRYDKQNPRTEILITRLDDGQNWWE
jgi:Holliday junction resolvase RusA-like endonuclease